MTQFRLFLIRFQVLFTAFIQISGFAFGAVLYAFLLALLIRKRPSRSVEWALLWAMVGALAWYLSGAVTYLYEFGKGDPPAGDLARNLQYGKWFGLCLISSAALHVALVRARRFAPLSYALLPASWLMLDAGMELEYRLVLAGGLAGAMIELLLPPALPVGRTEQRYRRAMAVALGFTLAGAAAGTDSAWIVLGAFAPALCLLYFISRYNVLGLYINRNIIFAGVLGAISALYLLLVRNLANLAEEQFDAWVPAIEVMLILAIAGIWVPLYAWMNRVLSKRAGVFADFGHRLIQDAAAIFGLEQRMEYIGKELARILKLNRVLLAATNTPEPRIAVVGSVDSHKKGANLRGIRSAAMKTPEDRIAVTLPVASLGKIPITEIAEHVRTKRIDAVIGPRSKQDLLSGVDARQVVLTLRRFNYVLPLWYEDQLVGLLFLDTSPRLFLDEDESILVGLSGQISQAIDSCILIERKIDLEKSLERSEHMASRGQMAARIAHEVRNPLASIKALAQLIQEDPNLKDNYRRDLSYIVGEVDRLNSCVQQLLTPPPGEALRSDVGLPELLDSICHAQNQEHAERNVRIEWRASRDLTLRNVDPQRLTQIVLNLVKNAAQASYSGGSVEMCAERNGGNKLTITVTDHGAGIPPEILPRVFQERFSTRTAGTGLGLAIVKRNVEEMGGDIQLESPVNGEPGTKATVTLPLEVA
jgi:signal transduction histidine kinase